MLELASASTMSTTSTSKSAPAPLRAAVSLATDLLSSSSSSSSFSSSSAASAPSLVDDNDDAKDGAGLPDADAVAAAISKDFANAYFLTSRISGEAYDQNCLFVDPTVEVRGLQEWRRNIVLLGRFLEGPRIELASLAVVREEEALEAEGDFGRGEALVLRNAAEPPSPSKKHAVVARWRLVAPVSLLPWRPVVDVDGVTVYLLAGEEDEGEGEEARAAAASPSSSSKGKKKRVRVVRHTESWGTSPVAAVAQLLVPGKS